MKKFVALFTGSYRELKSVRTITLSAMFAAVSVVLRMYSINIGDTIRISFSSIPNGMIACLFGPVVGSLFAGSLDVLNYLIKPTGAFVPAMTLVAAFGGLLYGCMYYKRPVTLWRVLVAKFLVMLVCNVFLNTLCLSMLYGQGFFVILPARVLKNLIMWPIDSVIFYGLAKTLESTGVFKTIKNICLGGN